MKHLLFLVIIVPIVALADDPFACVDPEFATAFLGTNFQKWPEYSTELPGAFDEMPVPDSLELIGSMTNNFSVQAVYKTTDDSTTELENVLDLLLNDGWRNLDNIMAMHSRGFQSGINPKMARVCRNIEPGILNVNVNDVPGKAYFSYSMTSYGDGQTCDDLEAQSTMFNRYGMGLMNELPTLKVPDGAQSSGAGSGGGGDEYHSDVVVRTEMSRASLVGFLGDQVRDQGWEFDTSWSGNLSSGSVWTKKSSQDELLIGTMHAYGETTDTYRVRFGVTRTETGGFAASAVIQRN